MAFSEPERRHQAGGSAEASASVRTFCAALTSVRTKAAALACILTVALLPIVASAQGILSVQIEPINEFYVEMPPEITITSATAGEQPDDVTVSTEWAFTTNASSPRKVTGTLDTPPPPGVTLMVDLGTPTEATAASVGSVGSASVGMFDRSRYSDVLLWSGARQALARGTATWTASATVEAADDQDYSASLTIEFE